MKFVKNEYGWDEIKTTTVIINNIWRNFMLNEEWISFNEKHPHIGKKRKRCKSCNKEWTKIGEDVALAFTNKGNKPICQTCTNYFETVNIKILIQENK